jgi:acyl-CoA synthetase (AMP-forming)/AMP-acid ligase II
MSSFRRLLPAERERNSANARGIITTPPTHQNRHRQRGPKIGSIALENVAVGHSEVAQAAVIAVPHPKWQERPLLIVVRKQGSTLDGETLKDYMRGKVADWWMPDDVAFVNKMPMTATGKIHKLALRERFK